MYIVFNCFNEFEVCTCDNDYKAEEVAKALNMLYETDVFKFRKED